MLVNTDTRAVDHDDPAVERLGNRRQQPIPDTGFTPPHKPVVARGVGAITIRNVDPRRSGPEPPEDAVEDFAVVNTRHTPDLVRQMRRDNAPFKVAKLIPTHSSLQKKP